MNAFGIIIEARTKSTRLPNKVLLKLGNENVLNYLIKRLKPISKKYNAKIIVATTTEKEDLKIIQSLKNKKIFTYRGSTDNVLRRVIESANKYNINFIIRVTSDCPLIDTDLIEQSIKIFLNNKVDIVTNAHVRSYPDGMDVEIIKTKALKKVFKIVKNDHEMLEHLSLGFKKYSKNFTIINLIAPPNLFFPNIGITLDEREDYILISKIVNYFKKKKKILSCQNILNFINKNKKISIINKKTKRTQYSV
jgi:spore coat polysaccharide biosynthesis protein SpsF